MKRETVINGQTFSQLCKDLRGLDVYNKGGFQIYKYELFYQGITYYQITHRPNKYTLKTRPE